jgi:predicted enzyme related to lactoylglutathione lyase
MMTDKKYRSVLVLAVPLLVLWACISLSPDLQAQAKKDKVIAIQFLEIVTSDVDATCSALEKVHGVSFSTPVPVFGNARTATLKGGGLISVRAPMRPDEAPVVRPYVLVDDIGAALKAAEAAGGKIAMHETPIPGHGTFGIYQQGGIDYGVWKLP